MKTEDMIVLALAGMAAWFILQGRKTGNGWKMPAIYNTTEISNSATGSDPGAGWRYFTDGTAIAPDGSYWQQGVKVWAP